MDGLVDAKPKLNLLGGIGEEEGETDGCDFEEHDDSLADSVTPPVTPTSDSDAVASQNSPLPCRNYRVVSNTCADSTSKKPLRLTLRAASPKEEPPSSAAATTNGACLLKQGAPTSSPFQRMSPSEPFQRIVTSTTNGLSPLKIVTSLSSASSSPTGGGSKANNLFFQSRVPSMEHVGHGSSRSTPANVVAHRNRSRASRTRSVNKKPRRSAAATASSVPQRKSRASAPEPSGRPSPRRSNGKRSSGGPTLNGYGVPASIEGMSSMKDFINYENFMRFKPDQQRTLASMLPRMDIIEDEFGAITISDSALKNEYFTKSLKEYLNKGYRVAAMTSQRYPLSTGHNTRQRRRNEFQGVDLSPKDEWKMTYFERFWGEKMEAKAESGEADCKQPLGLKQPVVKLTRAESAGSEDCLLKAVKRETATADLDTPPVDLESSPPRRPTPPPTKTRKRRQREPRESSTSAAATAAATAASAASDAAPGSGGGTTRKRRRKQASNSQLQQLHRGNQLCMTLPPSDNLPSPAGALTFVDDAGKGSGTAKTGSTSGPSNNSSSSPSTYGETSPPNEELGTPAEFIKPRPPPPPAQVSKPIVSQYFQFASGAPSPAASASGATLPTPLRSAAAAAEALNSRLGGKTVGELKRELACSRLAPKPSPAAVAAAAAAAQAAQVAAAQVAAAQAAAVAAAAAAAAQAAAAAANAPPTPPVSAPRIRRKYTTAARHFERQLATKEEAKAGAEPLRCKKSHDTRLRRLRRRNSCANAVDDGGGRASSVNSSRASSASGSKPPAQELPAVSASSAAPEPAVPVQPPPIAVASPAPATPVARPPAPRLSETLKASVNVLRTSDGVSLVFRDRVCPATLASALRRHPRVRLSLSFFVPGDALGDLQSRLQEAFAPSPLDATAAAAAAAAATSEPRPVVRWVERAEAKAVSVTFEEAAAPAAAAEEPGASPTVPWRRRDAAATDSCVPSPSPGEPLGISAAAAATATSSLDSHFLRQTESQVFRGQVCSEQRSFPTSSSTSSTSSCPPPPHSGPSSS